LPVVEDREPAAVPEPAVIEDQQPAAVPELEQQLESPVVEDHEGAGIINPVVDLPVEVLDDGSIVLPAEIFASVGLGECADVVFSSSSVQVYRVISSDDEADDISLVSVIDENENNLLTADDGRDDDTVENTNNSSDQSATLASTAEFPQVDKKGARWKRSQPKNWKKNVAKRRRKEGRKPKEGVCDGCRFKCTANITQAERLDLCNQYSSQDTFEMQKNFILANIEAGEIERHRARGSDVTEKEECICQVFFLEKVVCALESVRSFSHPHCILVTALSHLQSEAEEPRESL